MTVKGRDSCSLALEPQSAIGITRLEGLRIRREWSCDELSKQSRGFILLVGELAARFLGAERGKLILVGGEGGEFPGALAWDDG
jgi:hypothetical protein